MKCELCPRRCGVDRAKRRGYCGMGERVRVARAALHSWEEPCISGSAGTGAVFFSGCTLRCRFCQNREISAEGFGKDITTARLREIFEELIAAGASSIDLVSPTPFTEQIIEALTPPLPVPVIWNSGGYERMETLKRLEGKIDIYLPDLKYVSSELSGSYSGAADYFAAAQCAIEEMVRQRGRYRLDDTGLLRSGVLIRHLMLPGALADTKRVIDYVSRTFPPGTVLFSLMRQYTPCAGLEPPLSRRVSGGEYRAACEYMSSCGITDGYIQDAGAAQPSYTPPFDLTGVSARADGDDFAL